MNIGTRIAEERHRAGLSQSELAERAGMPVSSLQALEQGRYEPSWSSVARIAQALGLSVGPLGEGETQNEARAEG